MRDVSFSTDTRRALSRALRRAKPRPDASREAAILHDLEEVAGIARAMCADRDAGRIAHALATARQRTEELRQALVALMLAADDALAAAARVRREPPDLVPRLLEGLDRLADVLAHVNGPRRHGGRPRGAARVPGVPPGITSWYAGAVARVLAAHDVRPTGHRDGVFADVVRALWPAVLRAEAPADLQRLLRAALK